MGKKKYEIYGDSELGETKRCATCKEYKLLEEFSKGTCKKHKLGSRCKICRHIYYTSSEFREKQKEYYSKNKEKLRKVQNEYVIKNEQKVKESRRKAYLKHKGKEISPTRRIWIENNKESRKEYMRNYMKARRESDPLFRLTNNIRCLIRNSITRQDKKSIGSKILGCSFMDFKKYIESKFLPWMNWDNYGKYNGEFNFGWDLDHIKPTSIAKTEEEIYILNNWSNFQPLCSKVNRDIKINK